MRAGIRWRVELSETEETVSDGSFNKGELEAIATHFGVETTRGE